MRNSVRILVGGVFGTVAALASAGPAAAVNIDQIIEVPQCVPGTDQFCPQMPTVPFTVLNERSILVEFTGTTNGCSDIIAHIFLDGQEWGSNRVSPGGTDGGYEIPVTRGNHTIGVQAEGIEGGCNDGVLSAWGGNVHIESLQDPYRGSGSLPGSA